MYKPWETWTMDDDLSQIREQKCPVCGYCCKEKDGRVIEGDEPFIVINVPATTNCIGNYGRLLTKDVDIKMCPSCGVLLGKS